MVEAAPVCCSVSITPQPRGGIEILMRVSERLSDPALDAVLEQLAEAVREVEGADRKSMLNQMRIHLQVRHNLSSTDISLYRPFDGEAYKDALVRALSSRSEKVGDAACQTLH